MNAIGARRRQEGAILVIALLFLVLLTIIGISSISSVTLEEKMAGNLREQAIAFNAAESALRDAEVDLESTIGGTCVPGVSVTGCLGERDPITVATFTTNCSGAFTGGICRQPATPTNSWQTDIVSGTWDWTHADKTVGYGTYTGVIPLTGVSRQPRYVIEYLQEKDDTTTSPPTRYLRISARGWGTSDSSTVTLQTIYRMQMN
jgi:type IV pilus assembly protein PilX